MIPVNDGEGLAEERTRLAWSRSSLALLACGAAVLKGVPRLPDPTGRPLAGGIIVGLAAVAALVGTWEERARIRSVTSGAGAIDRRVVRRVAFANGIIGLAALALATLAS
ncbi:MAG: hypothetical protein QOC92_385 [Acidimicrobiaceae bacterium]